MIGKCKKIVTDITRKADLERDIPVYKDMLFAQYNYYATVKMCMNYYTVKEMIAEIDDDSSDLVEDYNTLSNLILKHIVGREMVEKESLEAINSIRKRVEYKMKN